MTRKLFITTLVAGIALLVTAPGARSDEKNQQSASNAASTQSSAGDQQKSATENAASNQSSSQNSTSASSNTNANAGTSSQSNQSDTNASANNSTNANTSNSASNNQNNQSTSAPALPSPSNDNARSDSKRTQDQSTSRDNEKSDQSRTSSQDRSKDNQARSDERNNQAQQDRSSDKSDKQARSDQRDNRSNDRDRNQRDVKSSVQVGRASSRGIAVDRVTRGSIFYESGLRDGDIIISYHGRRIRNRDDFDRYVIYERGRVPIVVWRDGRERTIYITDRDDNAGERSYISSDRNHGAYFGAEFDPQINDAAIVVRVDEGSPADKAGLKRDDHVMALNGKKVASGKEANDIVASMNPGDRVEIEFSRHGRTEAVLGGGRDQEVATRTTDRDSTTVEARDSNDSRRYDTSRDSNYRDSNSRDRSNSGSQQNRGIFGRRR